jgi:hypothetical protein
VPAPVPGLPGHEQLSCSSQEKPSPQSAAVTQPSVQRGTQALYDAAVQSLGAAAEPQSVPGSQAGASDAHSVIVRVRQTICSSQSASLSQLWATHCSTVPSHTGQSEPGAHAMAGHGAGTVSHV